MNFDFSEEQLEFKKSAIEFAKKTLNDGVIERDRDGVFSRELWKKCADFGIQGSAFPEQYGGLNTDIFSTMLLMEGLGYGCKDSGLIFAINGQMWTVQMPILTFGTEAQKEKYLPGLCERRADRRERRDGAELGLRRFQPENFGKAGRRPLYSERHENILHLGAGR